LKDLTDKEKEIKKKEHEVRVKTINEKLSKLEQEAKPKLEPVKEVKKQKKKKVIVESSSDESEEESSNDKTA
jgi:hypothetical protein